MSSVLNRSCSDLVRNVYTVLLNLLVSDRSIELFYLIKPQLRLRQFRFRNLNHAPCCLTTQSLY